MVAHEGHESRVTISKVFSKRETTKNLLAFKDLSGILFTKVKNFKKRKIFFPLGTPPKVRP